MNMTDYNNPNDNWRKRQDYYDRRERESGEVINIIVKTLLVCLAFALFGWLLSSCTTTKYVPVTETHTEHHWHTDSVKERDSTHTERETIIREVDSAAMARYGIQMEKNQRAWLILQREMEQRLRELEHMSAHKDTVRDSIPYPVEVVKEVERKPSKTERGLMIAGMLSLMAVIVYAAIKLKRFLP